MSVRAIEDRDIDVVLAIQAACPETAQWTMWDYQCVARSEMAGWVAEEAGQVVGFLVGRQVVSDLEILNFAVQPAARRRGVGASLLRQAIEWSKALGAANAFLEVRESNLAAIRFYERHNFRATGRRPHYYAAPAEDALVLALRLT